MTERIYYTDPYCRQFDALVTATRIHAGRPAVLLDRTAFYPASGGQPYDTGRLGATDVIETIDEPEAGIVHVLGAPLEAGLHVTGEINWARRFDHMQQHTGQHVLSAAFDRLFEAPTVSFHLGVETVSIDLAKEVTAEQVARAEVEANAVVWDDRLVSIRFVSPEEASAMPLRKESKRDGPLRLIEISDFDLSACGGTHVARTGEIGVIAVTGQERFKGGTRLSFACGGRALGAFRVLRTTISRSIRLLSVQPEELPTGIERALTEAKELRRAIKQLQEQLAVHEAARLVREAPVLAGTHTVVAVLDGWDAAGLKAIASAAAAHSRVAVTLFSTPAPPAVVVARSTDVGIDANAVLRALTTRFGGRGGGTRDLAQGGGLSGEAQEWRAAARQLIDTALDPPQ